MDIRHAVGVKENIDEETLAALREWRAPAHTHVDEVPSVVGLGAPSIAIGETTTLK